MSVMQLKQLASDYTHTAWADNYCSIKTNCLGAPRLSYVYMYKYFITWQQNQNFKMTAILAVRAIILASWFTFE